jgi:hypothetical protein
VSEAFTHGQAYVALSRCRTLSGMVLRNPVAAHNIIGDPAIVRFNGQAQAVKPDATSLVQDRELYRLFLMGELFNFQPLETRFSNFSGLLPGLEKNILEVAQKFTRQLKAERSSQAANYFLEKLSEAVESLHRQLPGLIGQSKEQAKKADQLIIWLMNRIRLMGHFAVHPFTTASYLTQTKNKISNHDRSYLKALNAIPNEKLFEQLIAWRATIAGQEQLMPERVLSERTAASIAEKMPATLKALSALKGVGPAKAAQYGAELIGLIRAYQQELQGAGSEQVSMF